MRSSDTSHAVLHRFRSDTPPNTRAETERASWSKEPALGYATVPGLANSALGQRRIDGLRVTAKHKRSNNFACYYLTG